MEGTGAWPRGACWYSPVLGGGARRGAGKELKQTLLDSNPCVCPVAWGQNEKWMYLSVYLSVCNNRLDYCACCSCVANSALEISKKGSA